MSPATRAAAAVAATVTLALALATIVASASSSPAALAPQPPKQEWRVCEDSKTDKQVLEVQTTKISPWPIEAGKPWSLSLTLKHQGRHVVRDADMTLKVFALKKLPVFSTTQDFCKASKKKHGGDAFVNMIAQAAAADGKKGGDDKSEGCPLKSGESTVLHFEGDWSAWAPDSDKYRLRVTVVDRELPDPESQLLCVDIDVVARKPPSAVAAS